MKYNYDRSFVFVLHFSIPDHIINSLIIELRLMNDVCKTRHIGCPHPMYELSNG